MITRLHIKRCIKSRAIYFVLLFITLYGGLVSFIPNFALLVSSVHGKLYRPMKVFYAFYSIFSMTFLLLPAYILFVYSLRENNSVSLELLRFHSPSQFSFYLSRKALLEGTIFSLILTVTIACLSLQDALYFSWGLLVVQFIKTILALWILSLLMKLFNELFKKHPLLSPCLIFLLLILDYYTFLNFKFPLLLSTILVMNGRETFNLLFVQLAYAFAILIILHLVFIAFINRKSFYYVEERS